MGKVPMIHAAEVGLNTIAYPQVQQDTMGSHVLYLRDSDNSSTGPTTKRHAMDGRNRFVEVRQPSVVSSVSNLHLETAR